MPHQLRAKMSVPCKASRFKAVCTLFAPTVGMSNMVFSSLIARAAPIWWQIMMVVNCIQFVMWQLHHSEYNARSSETQTINWKTQTNLHFPNVDFSQRRPQIARVEVELLGYNFRNHHQPSDVKHPKPTKNAPWGMHGFWRRRRRRRKRGHAGDYISVPLTFFSIRRTDGCIAN